MATDETRTEERGPDSGFLESADEAREATEEEVYGAGMRGLPESDSNFAPLPLEAIDATVNKAEGDHEALAENAYQEKVVRETDGVSFNGLTSVDEGLRDDLREDIADESDGEVRFGDEANALPAATDSTSEGPDATDSARELAAERGIDLSTVEGTGKDGRITQADVENHEA
jgi:2-oxoglutarate dehydrogenase E2 component (dihydrolipoamide succinyltransferase)